MLAEYRRLRSLAAGDTIVSRFGYAFIQCPAPAGRWQRKLEESGALIAIDGRFYIRN